MPTTGQGEGTGTSLCIYESFIEDCGTGTRVEGACNGGVSWITCARRPLTTLELQHALAVKEEKTKLDLGYQATITDMLLVC